MMLIGSGPRKTAGGIVELLLECHTRIRTFVDLADRLAVTRSLSEVDIRQAAHDVRRYFAEALPLHVEDEERTVLPRLVGLDAWLDAALEAMRREHETHETHVSTLIAICRNLEAEPTRHAALCAPLGRIATIIRRDFAAHLEVEEGIIFPAIDRWLTDQEPAMLAELRARRNAEFARASP